MSWYLTPLLGSSCYWAVPLSFAHASLLDIPDKNLATARNPSCVFVSLHKCAKCLLRQKVCIGIEAFAHVRSTLGCEEHPMFISLPCFGTSWSQMGQKVEVWLLENQKLPQSTLKWYWWGRCTSSGHCIKPVHARVNTNKYSQDCEYLSH